MACLEVTTPIDEEKIGTERDDRYKIDAGKPERSVPKPEGHLRQPFRVDPGLCRDREGIGLDMNEAMRRQKNPGIGQVPPKVNVTLWKLRLKQDSRQIKHHQDQHSRVHYVPGE